MADTRQFTDHNEIGGVNVYLEDKKLAESPEQNTVATTDYVLLKDTDGVPHKISKANMMSVVKDALADLLKNNDLGTSVTNVPALNSSAFGSATVANLASVLGDTLRNISSGQDLNDILDSGAYMVNATVAHLPSGINDPVRCMLIVHTDGSYNEGKYAIQYLHNVINGTNSHYIRTFDYPNWSSWKEIS